MWCLNATRSFKFREKKRENSEVSQEVTLADITKVYMGLIKGPPFEGYHHFPPKKASKSLGSFLHLDLELPKVKAKGSIVFSTKYEMNEDGLQTETWLTVKEDVFLIDYGDVFNDMLLHQRDPL